VSPSVLAVWLVLLAACSGAPLVSIAPPPADPDDGVRVAPENPLPVQVCTEDPAGGAVDGSVAEWGPPSVELGGAGGVRVWLAITKEHVRLAASSDVGPIGDVNLHVGMPVPKVPSVGWMGPFGLQTIGSADECTTHGGAYGPAARASCEAWFERAQAFRRDFPARFRREIVVGSRGLVVRRADGVAGPPLRAVVVRGPDQGTVEAELPLSVLPPIGAYPFVGGRIVVEVQVGPYVFASAPPVRAADYRTYGALRPDAPLGFGPRSELLAEAFAESEAEEVGCFVAPAPGVTLATCLANVAVANPLELSRASPSEVAIDVGKAVELASRGDVSLWFTPTHVDVGFGELQRIVRIEDGGVTWSSELHAGNVIAHGADGAGVRVLFADEGTTSPRPASCGVCPRIDVWWARFDASLESLGEGALETFESGTDLDLSIPVKGLGRFVVREEEGGGSPERRWEYRWSAKDAKYALEAPPAAKAKKAAKKSRR